MNGKYIVLTGKMVEKRKVLVEMIEARGGIVQSSVTNSTDFLVRNPLPDGHESGKTRKARQKGVTILSEDELMAAL